MDTVRLALEAAWKVLYTGLLLGAGLPIIFALGVRALAGPAAVATADGEPPARHVPSPWARAFAWLCFALAAYGVLLGLLVIIGAGQGKIVDFPFPILIDKP